MSLVRVSNTVRSTAFRGFLNTQRRTITESAVNKPNEVKKLQDFFNANPHLHGADNPTYLKNGATDKAANAFGAVVCSIGLLSAFSGLYSMSYGINKKGD
ncbi:unnamed protein product [Heterosigma akashiwo]